jgi:glycosyltransferase involved in cell wall biosynthesis
MIRVLGLALYGSLAASTRYRLLQYKEGLKEYDIDLEVRYLLTNEYLEYKFKGSNMPFKNLIKSGLKRLNDLKNQNSYDLIIIHCELFPLIPSFVELSLLKIPYIYDFDDAFFLKYRNGNLSFAKYYLSNKFSSVILKARAVTAGNKFLADYSRKYNLETYILPTVIDVNKYIVKSHLRGKNIFTIGWIGSPSTSEYLNEIIEPLSILGANYKIKLIVVGGKAPFIPNIEVIYHEWNEETEIDHINSFDVGIMPLPNNEWARGKCAFKLIQYMACSVPVISSPIGANLELVTHKTGLFAQNTTEWINAFIFFIHNPKICKEFGEMGRDRIINNYSLNNNLPLLSKIIKNN